jgi:nucleotide-binding universal stress UspA family protein
MTTVLVAIDESDASERVAAFVNDFFPPDDEIVGLNVATGPANWVPAMVGWGGLFPWGYPDPALADAPDLRTELHDQTRGAVAESGLDAAEAIGARGDPVDAILAAADRRGADLIVVGSNHRGAIRQVFEPSVSKQVTRHADRPVLVVP